MKIPALESISGGSGSVYHRPFDGSAASGIELQNYYNVGLNGQGMGIAGCNAVFDNLYGQGDTYQVRRCNDVYGCYRRVFYDGANGINGLRAQVGNAIRNENYSGRLFMDVNTRNSCA